jgi:hypothetical protein
MIFRRVTVFNKPSFIRLLNELLIQERLGKSFSLPFGEYSGFTLYLKIHFLLQAVQIVLLLKSLSFEYCMGK